MKARILRSPGYIPSFAAWCVSQGLSLGFEDVQTLDAILAETITDLKQCLAKERKLKKQSYNQFIWSSKNEDFNKEAFRRIKDQPFSPPVTSVVECRDAHITLWRRSLKADMCIQSIFLWNWNPYYRAKFFIAVPRDPLSPRTLPGKTMWPAWHVSLDVPRSRLNGTSFDPVNCRTCSSETGENIGINKMIKYWGWNLFEPYPQRMEGFFSWYHD